MWFPTGIEEGWEVHKFGLFLRSFERKYYVSIKEVSD